MQNNNSTWSIVIDEYSKTPKYKQIINSIIAGIESNNLRLNEKLPSVNQLLIEFDISRDTIVKAYDYLKKIQVIDSVPGKGYYVKSDNFRQEAKILLLFNKLSMHKKVIYDAFSNKLGDIAAIDFHIYHNNFRLFKNIIEEKKTESYTHYVIIPHFLEGGENAVDIINDISQGKLIILDKEIGGINNEYSSVFQDFQDDIYNAMVSLLHQLKKYKGINICFPEYTYHPNEIIQGFSSFCLEFAFDFNVIDQIADEKLKKDYVYIVLMEKDLVNILKKLKQTDYILGKDLGIISYNENPLKEILMNGITTISTDFKKLGETAADLVLSNTIQKIKNPFHVFPRNSL